ncbi:MAG TPA: hypothetical protein VFK02_10125 [Kofleriaceae bacterium]|nr:hypothetical protein [Kofleriaceae bacterium]
MSQRAHKTPNPRNQPTAEQKTQPAPPIVGLSPDDDVAVTSDDTGKKPGPYK